MKTKILNSDDTKNMPFSLSALQSYVLLKEIPTFLNFVLGQNEVVGNTCFEQGLQGLMQIN